MAKFKVELKKIDILKDAEKKVQQDLKGFSTTVNANLIDKTFRGTGNLQKGWKDTTKKIGNSIVAEFTNESDIDIGGGRTLIEKLDEDNLRHASGQWGRATFAEDYVAIPGRPAASDIGEKYAGGYQRAVSEGKFRRGVGNLLQGAVDAAGGVKGLIKRIQKIFGGK